MKHLFLLGMFSIGLFGCQSEQQPVHQKKSFPETSAIHGLASPVVLQSGVTTVMLEDYVIDVSTIDSVTVGGNHVIPYLEADKKTVLLRDHDRKIPALMLMKIWVKGSPNAVLLKKSTRLQRKLAFDPKGKTYEKVQVAGSFNDWNPEKTNMEMAGGLWSIDLEL